ncbi:fasciclin domain-containing protein [Sphingobacterium chuzhouense]|uniref:Fasciclin domain-containing protein n=1 Tax=Sphingobacterium chuzhouense TaxID=1742264 RepID=A0ABR7XMT3_9SPHI|nr:fasciclin domain-containing protein [Sphingobacterium chuzhouense]MBD1420480.1 fasciclin domain-containing protein [Sphingobacterium chuzhouense]
MRKLLLYTFSVFTACFMACSKKELVSHYERPDWLKGNSWEVLEDRGQFTLFLQAVERAGFKEILDGKTIATIFAPSDEAFQKYLTENNWSSVGQVPLKELKKLVGYHLIYYAYSKDMLENYQPNGSEARETNRAGLYYKHRTRSSDSISLEMDPIGGRQRKVFNKDRFLPVLSQTHFQTKGIDAAGNYEYFFGSGTWKGSNGFNVGNAGVTEYAIPTDNGYIYIVDEVLKPLKTLHATLEEYPDYQDFLKIYDRYLTYTYDEETSLDYGMAGDSLFSVSHGSLPPIASEWTTYGLPDAVAYFDLAGLAYRGFNVFAPNNQALKGFFDTYMAAHYQSLDQVDMLPLLLLMYNHVYTGNVVFPSEIGKNPDIKATFGTPIVFDPNTDVQQKAIASNGAFYGLDKVLVPDMFNSVTGAAFRNPKYRMFMYMLFKSGLYQTLVSKEIDFTLFIPSDEVLQDTYIGDSQLFWTEGNPRVFGDEQILVENSEGVLVPLSENQMENFISDHIVYDRISSLQEKKVYRTRNPYSYIYVADGKVYSTSTYNSQKDIAVSNLAGDWYNGISLDTEIAMGGEIRTIKSTLIGAESPINVLYPYAEFSKLLARAGLMEAGNSLSFLFGNRFLLFAPDNETVLQGLSNGTIPTEKNELAAYLKAYFVSVPDNSLSDYPFPGFGVQGTWDTALRTGVGEYRQISLADRGTSLELMDKDGTVLPIISDFPQVFSDGAVYRINKLLKR